MIYGLFFALAGAGVIYSTLIERNLLIKKRFNINTKNSGEKLRIVHFTDVHIGKFFNINKLENLVKKINESDADLVLLTGDLIDKIKYYKDDGKIDIILSKINAKIGKYAVYGNHDSYPGNRSTYAKILKNSGFKLLKNNNEKIEFKDKIVNLMGLDDFFQGKIDIKETTSNISTNEFNILMLHEPDLIREFSEYPINLALSGHSHGGQVFIPLYGTILNTGLAESYDRNLYTVGNQNQTTLYVNSGIGSTGLPIRFCCIPNISIIEVNI